MLKGVMAFLKFQHFNGHQYATIPIYLYILAASQDPEILPNS